MSQAVVVEFETSTGKKRRFLCRQPHGTYARSKSCTDGPHGKACFECAEARRAQVAHYIELQKAGLGNPIVQAARARTHLLRLARQGVGRRTVAEKAGVAHSTIQAIKNGSKPNIRANTERAILSVKPLDRRRYVDETKPLAMLAEMVALGMALGFPKLWIAERVVSPKARALQLRPTRTGLMTRKNADAIARLYSTLKDRGWLTEESARRVRSARRRKRDVAA